MSDHWGQTFEAVEMERVKAQIEIEKEKTKQAQLDFQNKSDRRDKFENAGAGLLIAIVLVLLLGGGFIKSCEYNENVSEHKVEKEEIKAERTKYCTELEAPAERQICLLDLNEGTTR